ncbi:MAG: hypothetical protein ACOYJ1_15720 [Peptococcales bacterium]|jgi:hypothetical protein
MGNQSFYRWERLEIEGTIQPRNLLSWRGVPGNENIPSEGVFVTSLEGIYKWTLMLGGVSTCGYTLYEVEPLGEAVPCHLEDPELGQLPQWVILGGVRILRRVFSFKDLEFLWYPDQDVPCLKDEFWEAPDDLWADINAYSLYIEKCERERLVSALQL